MFDRWKSWMHRTMELMMLPMKVYPKKLISQIGLEIKNISTQLVIRLWIRMSRNAPIRKNDRKNKTEFRIEPVTWSIVPKSSIPMTIPVICDVL